MAVQNSVRCREARLDSFEATVGAAPTLRIRTGTQPADCATASSGTVLFETVLPSDWMEAAGATLPGKKGKSAAAWEGVGAANGTAGHYEIIGTGSVCDERGPVTVTGGGGALTVANTSIALNQPVTITSYIRTAGNA